MTAIRLANDLLAFGLELASVAALAWWGYEIGTGAVAKGVLGLGAPAAFVAVWARWLAPRSELRLEFPWLIIAKVALFGLPLVAIATMGHPRIATGFACTAALCLAVAIFGGPSYA